MGTLEHSFGLQKDGQLPTYHKLDSIYHTWVAIGGKPRLQNATELGSWPPDVSCKLELGSGMERSSIKAKDSIW